MRAAKIVNLSLSVALLAGMAGLAGCGARTDNNQVRTQNLRNNVARDMIPQGTRMMNRNNVEQIRSLRYSQALTNKVAQLKDVKTAHVVVTDRDAYAAVTLHGKGRSTALGTTRPNLIGTNQGTTNAGGPYGFDYGTRGAGDNGMGRGLLGRTSGLTGPGPGTMGLNGMNRGAGTNSMYGMNYGTGSTSIYGTGTGTMIDGNRTGTVADNVPQSVKDQISAVVKKTAPHIRNVYVSGHPDFVKRVGTYATAARGGATLNDYIKDFQTMIGRIFPLNTGTMTKPNGYTPTGPNGNRTTTPIGNMTR